MSHDMLPEFAVLGTFKAGTTSLYYYLRQHPQIYLPVIKEPNFFAFDPNNKFQQQRAKQGRLISSIDEYKSLFKAATPSQVKGDVSTAYFQSTLAPERIKNTQPRLRMIVCLRNPVARAYSHYQMALRHGRESRPIETAFDSEAFWLRCSLYAESLQRYFDRFDRHQIKIILFDDLVADSNSLVRELLDFIGVNPEFPIDTNFRANVGGLPHRPWVQSIYDTLKKTPGLNMLISESMRQRARKLRDDNLRAPAPLPLDLWRKWLQFYERDIEQTQRLIGRDLSGWLQVR